jgi:hypothetical protein
VVDVGGPLAQQEAVPPALQFCLDLRDDLTGADVVRDQFTVDGCHPTRRGHVRVAGVSESRGMDVQHRTGTHPLLTRGREIELGRAGRAGGAGRRGHGQRDWSASVLRSTSTSVEVARCAITAHVITVLPEPGGATRTPSS